jgi:2-hydroxychromene-2-carboxylate isomerase
MPSRFPRASVLPLRIMLVAGEAAWAAAFAKAIMLANFRDDRDIGARDENERALLDLGLPATEVLERATAEATKAALRAQTEAARLRRVFGAPTFFVRGEMYWGNDRLEDALQAAQDARLSPPPASGSGAA